MPILYGKIPPQSVDLEKAILGAILIEKSAYDRVADILHPECFYTDAHQKIFRACVSLVSSNCPIDFPSVAEQLSSTNDLDSAGGRYYLVTLSNGVVSAANIEHHARIIAEKFMLREVIKVGACMVEGGYDNTSDVFELISKSELLLSQITGKIKTQQMVPFSDVWYDTVKEMQDNAENESPILGLRTGFAKLDAITNGIKSPDLIILAAGTSEGKSTLALQIAYSMGKAGVPVAYFSLEMKNRQLMYKMISSEIDEDVNTVRGGKLPKDKWSNLLNRDKQVRNTTLYMNEQGGLPVLTLCSMVRTMKAKHNIKIVFIDYLQLLTVDGSERRFGTREEEVNFISKKLKALGMELDIPVIALSQLNRMEKGSSAARLYKRSDLRESGALEQDADGVLFIWRPHYHGVEEMKLNGIMTQFAKDDVLILLEKWRLAEPGFTMLKSNLKYNRFEDPERVSTKPVTGKLFVDRTIPQSIAASESMDDAPF
jgi:replicative DNA helicase